MQSGTAQTGRGANHAPKRLWSPPKLRQLQQPMSLYVLVPPLPPPSLLIFRPALTALCPGLALALTGIPDWAPEPALERIRRLRGDWGLKGKLKNMSWCAKPEGPRGSFVRIPHHQASSQLCLCVQTGHVVLSDEDTAAWRKLFRFVDLDDSSMISRQEIATKMTPMLGPFPWEDKDHDNKMNFDEFMDCMEHLPRNKRHTALLWAKTECPDAGHTVKSTTITHITSTHTTTHTVHTTSASAHTTTTVHTTSAPGSLRVAPLTRRPSAVLGGHSDQDMTVWWKLFNYIDIDHSGAISKPEIDRRMKPLVGDFTWRYPDAVLLLSAPPDLSCRILLLLHHSTRSAMSVNAGF